MNLAGIYYLNVAGAVFGWIGDILSTLNQVFYNIVEGLLGMLETLITKTPYPQDGSGSPKFFGRPSGDMWGPMYDMYQTTSDLTIIILMILLVVIAGVRIFDDYLPQYASGNSAGRIVKMMFATVLWWPIGVAMLMLSDLLAQAVLTLSSATGEGGDQVDGLVAAFTAIRTHEDMGFSSGGGVEGIVLSLALLLPFVLQAGMMILLVFLWIIRYVFIYLLMPLMPLMFGLMAFELPGADDLKDVGETAIKTYISLVFLTFPAAVIVVVFGRMSGEMVTMIDSIIAGSGGTNATMTLADGAAATGDVAGIVSSVTTLIVGIGFMAALPLIAAGGPFILLGSGNDGIKEAAMASATGQIGGSVLGKGKKLGGSASSWADDTLADEVEEGAEDATAEGGSSGGSSSGETADQGGSAETETGSTSKFGRMKQKMASSINSASNIKEWEDKSMAEKTADIGGGAATASAMLGSKMKDEAGFMRRKGISGYAKTKSGNAKNKVGNALTKGKVGAGDGMASLKDRTGDMKGAIDENLDKSRNKLSKIKENPAEELSKTASQAGSAVMNSYRKKDFDQMSKKEKEELMKDMDLYEEWEEGDKTAEELYMDGKTVDRTTTQDVMEERAKDNKEKRDEVSEKLESKLKAAGAWDDYMDGMSARDALEQNIDGQEMKPEDLSYKEAHELGLNPAKADERSQQVNMLDSTHTRVALDEFYENNKDSIPLGKDEFESWVEDNGYKDSDKFGSAEMVEDFNNTVKPDNRMAPRHDYVRTVEEDPNDPGRDELDGKTREGYIEKYSAEEIEKHARNSGYVDENGNVKPNEYLQQEIESKERKGGDNTVQMGKMHDSMAAVFDDVERAEGVYTEDVASDVNELDEELEDVNRELGRNGKHLSSGKQKEGNTTRVEESADLTDTNMTQDERQEILSGDVSGPSTTTSREEIKDETVPGNTGSKTRGFTDVPNESGSSSEDTTDTTSDRESAAAEAVGEMFG